MELTQSFDDWTSYDEWLIQNYNDYGITSVEEENGKINIKYMEKAQWLEEASRIEAQENAPSQS